MVLSILGHALAIAEAGKMCIAASRPRVSPGAQAQTLSGSTEYPGSGMVSKWTSKPKSLVRWSPPERCIGNDRSYILLWNMILLCYIVRCHHFKECIFKGLFIMACIPKVLLLLKWSFLECFRLHHEWSPSSQSLGSSWSGYILDQHISICLSLLEGKKISSNGCSTTRYGPWSTSGHTKGENKHAVPRNDEGCHCHSNQNISTQNNSKLARAQVFFTLHEIKVWVTIEW